MDITEEHMMCYQNTLLNQWWRGEKAEYHHVPRKKNSKRKARHMQQIYLVMHVKDLMTIKCRLVQTVERTQRTCQIIFYH